MKHFIIDAHNVIHKSSFLKSQINTSIDVARNALLQMIKNYLVKFPSYKYTVIFDGIIGYNSVNAHNIKIQNSGEKEADELIKLKISKLNSTKNVIVVSSDHEITAFAKVYACEILSSESFLNLISDIVISKIGKTKINKKNKSEKPNTPSKKEMNEFLELFTKK